VVETDWEQVRDTLLAGMTNFGQPYIVVEDADFSRNRELFLKHCYEGQELDMAYAEKTMRQVHRIWGRAVHLETVLEDKPTVLSFDGQSASARTL
jgi:stage V sporulation protein R